MKFAATNTEELFQQIREHNAKEPSRIMFCTPAYGGVVGAKYMLAMVSTVELLTHLGFEHRISVLSNNSLVPHARNALASAFLHGEEYTHLFFIDADIEWSPEDVIKLWLADRDVAAGVYPKKRINWELIERAAASGKSPLADFSGDYVFNPVPGDTSGQTDEHGMVEVQEAGTGFMLVKRAVFERLKDHAPVYRDSFDNETTTDNWEFFPIGPRGGRYQSEDYSFCELWRDTGGKIYLNPFLHLGHVGTYTYRGSLARLGQEPL
jgi:hypothetical protein